MHTSSRRLLRSIRKAAVNIIQMAFDHELQERWCRAGDLAVISGVWDSEMVNQTLHRVDCHVQVGNSTITQTESSAPTIDRESFAELMKPNITYSKLLQRICAWSLRSTCFLGILRRSRLRRVYLFRQTRLNRAGLPLHLFYSRHQAC